MTLEVYGIPTCSTCKKAMQWLEARSVAYKFVNTKEVALERDAVAAWVAALTIKSTRNTSGYAYRALGEERNTWTEAEWVEAFVRDPMLLKRPLFVKDGKAVMVGFRGSNEAIATKLGL